MCVWIFSSNSSETFLILRRIQRDIVINVQSLHVKYPSFLSDFSETYILYFRIIVKYKISGKSFRWEPICSIRTDRRTVMTKLLDFFRSFAKAPNETRRL
jgi:hypothetical protein